jgi:hypothetical protein
MRHGIIFKIKLFLSVGFDYWKAMKAIKLEEERRKYYP